MYGSLWVVKLSYGTGVAVVLLGYTLMSALSVDENACHY